ncbi:MAG: emp24/gp25L/p24 family protein [Dehalococcoidia bacterium]|nr:emp24/gp25L/p24 family protein [Dehalococcoidia bacterium]
MELFKSKTYQKILVLLILIVLLIPLSACSRKSDAVSNSGPSMVTDAKTFPVGAGKTYTLYIRTEPKDSIEASFNIMGGEHDIDFMVQDPVGNLIMEKKRATDTGAFAFVAAAKGYYQVTFDNAFSTQSNKLVWLKITHPSTGGIVP